MAPSDDVPLLPYPQVRPLIKNGDLVLCQGTSAFARLIRLTTGSDWSHVGVLLWHEQIDRLFCFESVESVGVQNLPFGKYIHNYDETGHGYPGRVFIARHRQVGDLAGPQLITSAQRAVDLLGTKYGNKDIGGIALRLIEDFLKQEPRPIVHNNILYCSEYAALFLASLKIAVPYNRLNYISPHDFATCPDISILYEIVVEES